MSETKESLSDTAADPFIRVPLVKFDFNALPKKEKPIPPPECPDVDRYQLRLKARLFKSISNDLKKNLRLLKQIYQPNNVIPIESEEECCTYCLGSEMCASIFKSDPDPSVEAVEAHYPMLGDCIHLNRKKQFILLEFLIKWFKTIGMELQIHLWIFALMVCVNKPVEVDEGEIFDSLYNECKSYLYTCEDEELYRAHVIMAMIELYFYNIPKVEIPDYVDKSTLYKRPKYKQRYNKNKQKGYGYRHRW